MAGPIRVAGVLALACAGAWGCASTRSSGSAADPPGSAATERVRHAAAAAAGGDEVVCSYEAPLGTLVRRHVCRTRSEQQRDRERTRTWVEDLRRRH